MGNDKRKGPGSSVGGVLWEGGGGNVESIFRTASYVPGLRGQALEFTFDAVVSGSPWNFQDIFKMGLMKKLAVDTGWLLRGEPESVCSVAKQTSHFILSYQGSFHPPVF